MCRPADSVGLGGAPAAAPRPAWRPGPRSTPPRVCRVGVDRRRRHQDRLRARGDVPAVDSFRRWTTPRSTRRPRCRWLTWSMSACPTLTTERLVLRPFRADDLGPFHAAMTTDAVRASLHVTDDYSPGETWRTMCSFLGLWELRVSASGPSKSGDRPLRRPGRSPLAGGGRLARRRGGLDARPGLLGSGLATEAGARAVRYGFEELGEDTLYSVILPPTRGRRRWPGASATSRARSAPCPSSPRTPTWCGTWDGRPGRPWSTAG